MKADTINRYEEEVKTIHLDMHHKIGARNESLGWLDLPENYNKEEFEKIKQTAEKIQRDTDILLVIGVGGSYLGARAAIEALSHSFKQLNSKSTVPQIIFVGHNLNSTYMYELLEVLDSKEISINVISKSGTTLEPAIAFRIFKNYLEKRYGKKEARNRIFVTTDQKNGLLRQIAERENYQTFCIPKDVGGRYSILTAVGLLPIQVSGISIDLLMSGAREAMFDLLEPDISKNVAYQYAVIRKTLYEKGKWIEILVNYDPKLFYLSEWWKQLFGESEGKKLQGIFPAAATYTTDLHSLGQYVQDGRRTVFQTILHIKEPAKNIHIKRNEENLDNLNYLAGKSLHAINEKAFEGALKAHTDGGVPNLIFEIPKLDPFQIGYLFYFFQKACAMSGKLFHINPFDQPGVEAYKKNMFELLERPGYEKVKTDN